ncbi:MAG TPA: SGNH/GDSL hydrolase family protein [Jatrophihabitans sp.]
MRRLWTVLLLLLTATVAAGAGYVVTAHDSVPRAGQTPGIRLATDPSLPGATPSGSRSSGDPSNSAAAPAPGVAFLGDDYTAGVGASSARNGWTARLARALRVHATTAAQPGAGYAARGIDGGSYQSLVGQVVAAHPGVVIVSGGRNDVADDPATLHSAARTLFADLHEKLPEARLVAVAPFWGDSAHPPKLTKVDVAVRAGVQAAGGTYLDTADPLTGHPEWMADAADPNDRGYAAIATALAAELRTSVPR